MNDWDGFEEGRKIVSIFDQGKRFTEELLKENERLRSINNQLKEVNRSIKQQMEADGVLQMKHAIEVLRRENEALRKEMEQERKEAEIMEAENREFADRYVEVERQNSDLITMYVASYQLHSTLEYKEVVKTVKDITINMIGGEVFGIYVIDHESKQLKLIAHEGLEGLDEPIPLDDDRVREALVSGAATLLRNKSDHMSEDKPVAVLPLKLGDDPYGIILIYKLLIQKEGFRSIDYELVELLGKHAASAIYSAELHMLSERKLTTLEGLMSLIKGD